MNAAAVVDCRPAETRDCGLGPPSPSPTAGGLASASAALEAITGRAPARGIAGGLRSWDAERLCATELPADQSAGRGLEPATSRTSSGRSTR